MPLIRYDDISAHLRQLRDERGLTLVQAVERITKHGRLLWPGGGVTVQKVALRDIENGLLAPSIEQLQVLAEAYGVLLEVGIGAVIPRAD